MKEENAKENNILVEVKVINTPVTGEVKVKKLESDAKAKNNPPHPSE